MPLFPRILILTTFAPAILIIGVFLIILLTPFFLSSPLFLLAQKIDSIKNLYIYSSLIGVILFSLSFILFRIPLNQNHALWAIYLYHLDLSFLFGIGSKYLILKKVNVKNVERSKKIANDHFKLLAIVSVISLIFI